MRLSIETKVGIFFIVGLAILAVVTFKVEHVSELLKRQATMMAKFPHASSLKPGDPVAVAGVKVGEVKEIRLLPDGVQFILSIDQKVKIRTSSVATLAWGGLLGNRYVDISLGSPLDEALPPDSEIKTGPSIELGEVLKKVDAAASELQDMLKSSNVGPKLTALMDNLLKISDDIKEQRGTAGKLVGSDELYKKALGIADDLKDSSARINKLVAQNDERINSILKNLDEAVPEAKDAFAGIKRIADQVDTGKGLLSALLNDEQMYKDLKDSLARLSKSLDRIDEMTKNMQEGKGLIARLSTDEQLSTNFSDMIASLKNVSERIDKGDNTIARLTRDKDLYQDVKKVLDDARETLRSIKEQVPVGTFASVLLNAF